MNIQLRNNDSAIFNKKARGAYLIKNISNIKGFHNKHG